MALIFCSLLLFLPHDIAFSASVNYARVLSSGAYIYSDQALSNKIFEVPYSYYVKIEQNYSQTVKVSYNSPSGNAPVIYGYMSASDLTVTEGVPSSPFAVIKVSSGVSDVLFVDHALKSPLFNVPENEIMYFYGKVTSGDKTLCYVYYGNKLGYIDEKSLNPYVIPTNPDPLPSVDEPPETDKPTTVTPTRLGETLQIVIIVGISVISISIVYFLFRPQKNETHEETGFITDDET